MGDLVESLFPPSERQEARAELARYPGDGKEPDRVRRAILVLSAGSLEDLRHFVDAAIEDYRDVIFWAEHPDESRS